MRKPPSARSAAVAARLAKPGSSVTFLVRLANLEPLQAVGRYVEEAARRSELHYGNGKSSSRAWPKSTAQKRH